MTPESAQPTLPFLKRPVVRAALVPLLSVVILLGGFVLWLMTRPQLAHDVMFIGLLVSAIPLLKQTVLQATRGNFATDAVAAMAIVTAIVLDQPVPGLVIVLMQSGGEALEAIAQRRATHALNELEDSAPRVAHRQENNAFVDVLVRDLREGDVILVKPGDVTPADAIVVDGRSHVDTSRITGEPLPISASKGTVLLSGCVALNGAMQMRVLKVAAESQYERIVEMVRTALARKAPIQRIADRYAVWFTPITAVIATLAYVISDNPMRALAVLVVATPCPLILATPVAI
ncbi:MAG TPA: HAD-IC family P-type ATPase, partial [Longimicrobiales bacterium]